MTSFDNETKTHGRTDKQKLEELEITPRCSKNAINDWVIYLIFCHEKIEVAGKLGLKWLLLDFSVMFYHFSNKKFAEMRLKLNIDSV